MVFSPYASTQIIFFLGTFLLFLMLGNFFCRFLSLSTAEKSRYTHLDGLRALSAIAVVACHTNQHLLAFFGFTEIPELGNRIGIIGVQMFFALTAFLFTERALKDGLNSAEFYIGRARRIVPLYVFVAACTVILGIYMAESPFEQYAALLWNVVDIFAYGFIGSAPLTILDFNAERLIGVAWTLAYEWKFYLAFPLLFFLAKSSSKLALLLTVAAITIAARDFARISETIWPFFLTGIFVAYLRHNSGPFSSGTKKLISLLALPLLVTAATISGYFSTQHLFLTFALFLSIVIGEPGILKVRSLQAIGAISYSVYLLQYLILAPVVEIAHTYGITESSTAWKFFVAFSVPVLLVPLSVLSYRMIEIPWMVRRPKLDLKGGAPQPGSSIKSDRVIPPEISTRQK